MGEALIPIGVFCAFFAALWAHEVIDDISHRRDMRRHRS